MSTSQSSVPRQTVNIPGHPALQLHLYGAASASSLGQDLEQALYVTRGGVPVSRAEQTPGERQAVLSCLLKDYPEHAMLILGKSGVLAVKAFQTAVAALDKANAEFTAGRLRPVPHSRAREAALCEALVQMAASLGCELDQPISIDSRGELRCITKGRGPWDAGSGRYGTEFAAWLNSANPRTGVAPGAHLLPESGWCYLNHFEAEKLVQRYAAILQAPSA